MLRIIAFLFAILIFTTTPATASDVRVTNVSWNSLPFQDAIVIKKGNGSRKLVIFSDPRCSYCRKFSKELDKVNNLTLYVFPVAYFDGSDKIIQNVWCSSNRSKTWTNLMNHNITPPTVASCNTPTRSNRRLADRVDVRAIPTLMTEDGVIATVLADKDLIEKILTITYPDK